MAQLQRPPYVYFDGAVRRWEEAVFHVSSEAVVRGLNVFEGLKGYWQADGGFGFVLLREHHARLARSARLLHLPFDMDCGAFERACFDLTKALYERDHTFYVRATLFAVEGHYGLDTKTDLVLTGYQQPLEAPAPITVGVSTWRRSPDVSLPARIKTSTNYQVARLARIEGRDRGYEDMILLNQAGRVAESTGACVLMVRDGCVSTPPASEGALESITLRALEAICSDLGVPFERRPIERTELSVSDELGLCGTLSELTLVTAIDGMRFDDRSPVLSALRDRYRAAVTGVAAHPHVEMALLDASDDLPRVARAG